MMIGEVSMTESMRPPGKTTIAPEVLVTIARLTALSVPGVNRLAPVPSEMERFFSRGISEGIKVAVDNDKVYTDIYVVVYCDMNVKEISHTIQNQVSRAIAEMVGMDVGKVNVHIEDIDYTKKAA
jgi:uncharacterized alkaline shock family protein YloU